jgi:hypothetical protein
MAQLLIAALSYLATGSGARIFCALFANHNEKVNQLRRQVQARESPFS